VDDGKNTMLAETSEAIDPWPDINFEGLEAQLCVEKAKKYVSIRLRLQPLDLCSLVRQT